MVNENLETKISQRKLLQLLQQEYCIEDYKIPEIENFLKVQHKEEMPLYIRGLIGVGAFIATIFFLFCLSIADLIDYRSSGLFIIWGTLFVGAAIFVYQIAKDDSKLISHSFMTQVSFCFVSLGKILLVAGFAIGIEKDWAIPFAGLVVTCITYPFYKMFLDRFLSSLGTLLSCISWIYWGEISSGIRPAVFSMMFILQLVAVFVLLTNKKVKREFMPIAYAFAVAVCFSVILTVVNVRYYRPLFDSQIHVFVVNVTLIAFCIATMIWAAGRDYYMKEPMMVAYAATVILGFFSVPGVFLGVSLLILGYAHHNRFLLTLGSLALPYYIFMYYYQLKIGLAEKSLVLIVSGLIFLIGSAYIHFYQRKRGEA